MARDAAPQQENVADFYDESSRLLNEVTGGSLHFGYWEPHAPQISMMAAADQLTDMMIKRIGVGPGDTVLDVGCGTGGPAVRLVRATGARVVGITISPDQFAQATEFAAAAGLSDRMTFACADAMDVPFPAESFDAVWLFESIFHMPNRLEPLRQAARVLRPGGRLSLTDVLHRTSGDEPAVSGDDLPFASLFGESMTIDRYPALLTEAGLLPVEVKDITEQTVVPSLENIHRSIDGDRERLSSRYGVALVDQVDEASCSLGAAGLGYAIVSARRPD